MFNNKVSVKAFIVIFCLISGTLTFFKLTAPNTPVSGVVYANSGVPINNAIVVAFGENGSGTATTNSLGQYLINEGLKTGNYTVNAIVEGYLVASIDNVQVEVGLQTAGVDFFLSRSGGIAGRVTDADSGAPLADVLISVYMPSDPTFSWTGITDSDGYYKVITNLATGTYNVSAVYPQGYIMKTLSGIAITAGAMTTGVDLALDKSGAISGRVTSSINGLPVGNATVSAASDDGEYFGFAETNETGHYKISSGLGTGDYTVYVMRGFSFNYTTVSVVAGEETSNVDIQLGYVPQPSGIITGKVVDTEDQPIADALVTADGPNGSGQSYTDEEGNYAISEGLGTGTYTVNAQAAGYVSKNITDVSVTVGEITENVNFQLEKIPPEQSGSISGTVTGEPNPVPETSNLASIFLTATLAVLISSAVRARKLKRQIRAPCL